MVLIAGVDEAGKGSVIGEMCVSGVMTSDEKAIERLGLRDSKKLTRKQRQKLAVRIEKDADKIIVLTVSASQIDELRKVMTMNRIMVLCTAKVLEELKPEIAYLDSPDVKPERFKEHVAKSYRHNTEIISEHRADENYPIVAAASIIAKVERDRLIEDLKERTGYEIGSGYPSDPKTKRFMEEWIQTHETYPSFVRKTWKTAERLLQEKRASTKLYEQSRC
ncbi:Ribonuclease HII [Candidatus Methanoperedenaceae archaeon GB50]|nr:Ribonuclease HII [Candidatus Methanoperedenaceae archaeon GB50]CAD7776582.1 MAG: Ribonuclease HII [Candidatus Methanoperedenaceae archaeon GB50]